MAYKSMTALLFSTKELKQMNLTLDVTVKYCRPTIRATGFDLSHLIITDHD